MLLALVSLLASTAAPACGCAPFQRSDLPAATELAAEALAIRDFALFSHRKLADDLVRQDGPYLNTLLAELRHCPDRAAKLAWLRRQAGASADTAAFAISIAQAHQQGASCPPRDARP